MTWNDFTGFLTIVNLKTNAIVQQIGTGNGTDKTLGDGTVAADGPLWSADGKTLWFPQAADMIRFAVGTDGTVSKPVVIPLTLSTTNLNTTATKTDDLPSGMALSPDGSRLYVALNGINQLGVIDTTTNQVVQTIDVGNAPRQVVLVGNDAFVSNEGGRPAKPGEYTNQSDGTNIVSDKVTGAASTGTVSEVDLSTGREVKEIKVGLQPTAEYLAADGTLMVANSNDDSFSLINPSIGRGRPDHQCQPATRLDRRQLPQCHHHAGRRPHPGQYRARQRHSRLRLQRAPHPGQVRGPDPHRLLPGQRRLRPRPSARSS